MLPEPTKSAFDQVGSAFRPPSGRIPVLSPYRSGGVVSHSRLLLSLKHFCLVLYMAPLVVLAEQPSLEHPESQFRSRLHKIEIEGSTTLGLALFQSVTGLHEGSIYSPDSAKAAVDSSVGELRFRTGRYFLTLSGLDLHFDPDSTYFDLRVRIDDGLPTVIDSIEVQGPLGGRDSLVRQAVRSRQGSEFDQELWEEDIDRITTEFAKIGFPFVRVEVLPVIPDFRETEVGLRIGVDVTPGEAVVIDGVVVTGLNRTRPEVARRILRLNPGGRFHPGTAEGARRRLLQTGWFESVDTAKIVLDGLGGYMLVYRVREQPTNSVDGALGFAPRPGERGIIAGIIDISLENLFGTGRAAEFHWRRDSPRLSSFAVGYREPYLFNVPLQLNVRFEQSVTESLYVATQFALGLAWSLSPDWTVTGSIVRRQVHADSLALAGTAFNYTLTGGEFSVEHDTRDSRFNPTHGGRYWLMTGRYEADARAPFGTLYRNEMGLDRVQAAGRDIVLYGGAEYREARIDSGILPRSEHLRTGGALTVRGSEENSIEAPRLGWINLEVRRIIGQESRLFTFYDVAWAGPSSMRYDTSAWGGGAQIGTGIGILSVSIAIPSGEGFSAAFVHALVRTRF